jgi:glycine/D-amino acid oxidase-like deaminating enzyme
MTESPAPTFYAAMASPAPARPPLAHDIETEICVVGGGFAGLWAARALAASGKEVVLLDRGEIAGGASGQNGGFVSAGYAARLSKIIDRVGLDHARELYRLSRDGVEIVRKAMAADPRAMDAKPGRLHVLRRNDEVGLADHASMLSRDFGHDLALWKMDRVRGVLASDKYYQALHEADAFHLNPLNLARLLAAEIEDRGGRIFEHTAVVEADVGGLRKSLNTGQGRVRAFHVVLAGSSAIGDAFPWLQETILPIRTHVAVTAPLGGELKKIIRYEGAIADTRRAGDYYHLAGDRLMWGGRISARGAPRHPERLIGKDIARVYPQLKGVPIEYAWSGVMGYAIHMMPQIGMVQPGVWVSTAFGGQGLNTSAMAGDLIASAITEQDDRWRLFLPFGLVWNGGKAGRFIAQTAYWGMQAKDWLDEAQTRAVERDEAAIGAGLAPGIAAHTARRAKKSFIESSIGRASILTLRVLKRAGILALLPFLWTGRQIDAGARAVGRALIPVIWFIAGIIGFIARMVGRGMDAIAAVIAAIARVAAKVSMYAWNRIFAPATKWAWAKSKLGSTRAAIATRNGAVWTTQRTRAGALWAGRQSREKATRGAQLTAAFASHVWRNAMVPASKRFSQSAKLAGVRAKAGSLRALDQGRRGGIAVGHWSARQPGVIYRGALAPLASKAAAKSRDVRRQLADARTRRAEEKRAATIAAKEKADREAAHRAAEEKAEQEKAGQEQAARAAPFVEEERKVAAEEASPPAAEESEKISAAAKSKKKKSKHKKTSVEA